MGFKIFASGITGSKSKIFNYEKKNCLYQGDFTTPKVLALIPAPTKMGVAKKVFTAGVSGWSAKGMFKIAHMEMAHMVATGVNLLAIEGRSGKISLYAEEEKWYWADSNSFVEFYLNSSNPGRDFLKKSVLGTTGITLGFGKNRSQRFWRFSSNRHVYQRISY